MPRPCWTLPSISGNTADVIVEIGFGNGESTWRMAQGEPDKNFIGIEVHEPGVGQLLMALEKHAIDNVRIVRDDAVTFLQQRVARCSAGRCAYLFSRPLAKETAPQTAHHPARFCEPTGPLHGQRWNPPPGDRLAAYAEHMLEVMAANPDFINLSRPCDYCHGPTGGRRPSTSNAVNGWVTWSGTCCTGAYRPCNKSPMAPASL